MITDRYSWTKTHYANVPQQGSLRLTPIRVYHPQDSHLPEKDRRLLFKADVEFYDVADGVDLLATNFHFRIGKYKVRRVG